ncbi:putative g-protein alpha subunit, partial [Moniliophthora roreri]
MYLFVLFSGASSTKSRFGTFIFNLLDVYLLEIHFALELSSSPRLPCHLNVAISRYVLLPLLFLVASIPRSILPIYLLTYKGSC